MQGISARHPKISPTHCENFHNQSPSAFFWKFLILQIPFGPNLQTVAIYLLTLLALAASVAAERFEPGRTHASSHVIVKFKQTALAESETAPAQLTRLQRSLKLPEGARLEEPAFTKMRRARAAAGQQIPAASDFLYLHLPPGLSVEAALDHLKKIADLEYAEPDGIGRGGGASTIIPTDPSFNSQWHHRNTTKATATIHTPEAWTITTGSSAITVAVLDTGVNTNLIEFAGRVVPGASFVTDVASPLDDHGHGTMAASTVCANANNGAGGAGVDWNCKLMPVKVLDQNNYGLYSWWAQGINYAVANGAKVINLSSGGSGSSAPLTGAINNAIAAGVIFVTITHNDGTSIITYPGNLTSAITVGATDRDDVRCNFSNYGSAIDLVAPGLDIYGMSMNGGIEFWYGTSFAAPQVAGAASLLAAIRPSLNQSQMQTLLRAGAEDQVGNSADVPGFDVYYGAGRLNIYNSLLLAQTQVDQISTADGALTLSWPTPPNASSKKPYEVYFRTLEANTWTRVATTNFITFTPNRASWSTNAPPAGLYQIAVR